MPPLPRISSPMLVELARELRFAPPATLLKAVDRAESLAADLDPDAALPAEWVVFRLTGYRPERWPDDPALAAVSGRQLLQSLSALTELLTHHADWTWQAAEAAHAVDRATLARRWRVSLKTLDRLKAQGLLARRARRPDGKVVLAFMPSVVEACRRAHGQRLAEAATATRLSPDERRRTLALAHRFRRRFGSSLHLTATRLAHRLGRSVETLRQLLRAEEARRQRAGEPPVFAEPGPVQHDRRRWIERAWRRGAEPADLARHARCGRPAIQRAINLTRHQRLLTLADTLTPASGPAANPDRPVVPPDFASIPALQAPKATTDLGLPGATDLAYLLESARHRAVVPPRDEHARLHAYHALRALAASWTRATPRLNPQSEPLDAAETALRWAARLKAELIRPLWPLMLETIETVLRVPLDAIASDRLLPLLDIQLAVAAQAVDHTDPAGGGRVAGSAALDLSTAAARWLKAHPAPASSAGRAARSVPRGLEIPDWTRRIAAWQDWLEPDRRIRPLLSRLAPIHAEVLTRRMGWAGHRPLTLTETAAAMNLARLALPRLERAATREALRLAQSPP